MKIDMLIRWMREQRIIDYCELRKRRFLAAESDHEYRMQLYLRGRVQVWRRSISELKILKAKEKL